MIVQLYVEELSRRHFRLWWRLGSSVARQGWGNLVAMTSECATTADGVSIITDVATSRLQELYTKSCTQTNMHQTRFICGPEQYGVNNVIRVLCQAD